MNFDRNEQSYRPAEGNRRELYRSGQPKGPGNYEPRENHYQPGFTTRDDRPQAPRSYSGDQLRGNNQRRGNNSDRPRGYNDQSRGQHGNQHRRPRQGGPRQPAPRRPPMEGNKLYFIALLPTAEVGKEIIRLKQEFAEHYDARHALRVLPHITIQVPFMAQPSLEKAFCTELTEFAATLAPFEVQLNGFGVFPYKARKVLYINVEKNEAIVEAHRQLVCFLRKEFGFSSMLARYGFTPHISVAFNDLTDQQFDAAWKEYEHKPFRAAFRVNNLYLLRHSGTSWEVLQKCRLGAAASS